MNTDKFLKRVKDSTYMALIMYSLIRVCFPEYKEYAFYFAYYFIVVGLAVEFIKWFRSVKADG
jgi:hypothetical protein